MLHTLLASLAWFLLAPQSPSAAPARRATVDVGGGCALVGDLVKETAGEVFVDLGYTILAVPRTAIAAIHHCETPQAPPAELPLVLGDADRERLYARGGAPLASVRESVERVDEAAVVVRVPGGLGSGFVIDSAGWIVTNAHVIDGEQEVSVTVLRSGAGELEQRVFDDVELVALNTAWDLALLRIPAEDLADFELRSVPLGSFDEVVPGEVVFALGNPMGLERTVSEGIVSSKTRAIGGMLYLQTTAAINPGNSGGALFNLRGEVIGVNTLKGWGEGLGFSVPVSTLEQFLDHRTAFAFDKEQPNNGYRYPPPPAKPTRAD